MPKDKIHELSRDFFMSHEAYEEMKGYITGQRRIPLIGKIDEDLVNQAGLAMIQMDFEEKSPITLLIHSNGGDVENAFYLQNVIQGLHSPVDGLVIGRAASMAVDVLQMCRRRLMLTDSRLYCHFIRIGFDLISDSDTFTADEVFALRQKVLDFKRAREQMYAKRTGKTIKEIQRLFRLGEVYNLDMSAKEALRQKLIDEIVTDFKFFLGRHYKK